jgi:hypothetical protein
VPVLNSAGDLKTVREIATELAIKMGQCKFCETGKCVHGTNCKSAAARQDRVETALAKIDEGDTGARANRNGIQVLKNEKSNKQTPAKPTKWQLGKELYTPSPTRASLETIVEEAAETDNSLFL